MEFQDLNLFMEVAKQQSFSRAAAEMHMGQPAVSLRIAALENTFGKSLFERHRRGVRLTPAGQTLLNYAERINLLMHETVTAVSTTRDDPLRIRLVSPSTVNSYLWPPILTALADAGHSVDLKDAHSHEAMQYVLDGSADVGLVIDVPNQPGIERIPVHTDPIICVTAPMHPLAIQAQACIQPLAALAPYRLVFYKFSIDYEALIHHVKTAISSEFANFMQITPAESIKAILQKGDFVSFLPRMTVVNELNHGDLVAIPLSDLPEYTWNIALVHRQRKELSKSVTAVIDAVKRVGFGGV